MSVSLAQAGALAGVVFLGFGLAGLLWPRPTEKALMAFPRHRVSGILLAVINVLWVSWLLHVTPLGMFDSWKRALVVLSPLTLWLVIRYMDELLAPRMLGGFILLLAVPLLDLIRWHDSGWRLVLTATVYVFVVLAMVWMLSPYRFRHISQWIFGRVVRLPFFAGVAGLGGWLVFLSAKVY
jgi:hypothetical protein